MENESYWDRKGYMEITCRHEVSWMGLAGQDYPSAESSLSRRAVSLKWKLMLLA